MNKKDIVESIDEIQMLFSADEENSRCWESVYCPYCMLGELKSKLKKEISNEHDGH